MSKPLKNEQIENGAEHSYSLKYDREEREEDEESTFDSHCSPISEFHNALGPPHSIEDFNQSGSEVCMMCLL